MSGVVLVGLLGCGRAAEQLHVPAILRTREARLTAACDPVPERRRLVARAAPGCRAFATAEELFASRSVDAVLVASPPATHVALAELALRAGVPVLVEMPMAASLAEAIHLAELERTARGSVMVGFNRRWWEPAQALHHALARRDGLPLTAETRIVGEAAADTGSGEPTDPLADLAVHHLHLLPYLLDHVIATVHAHRPGPSEVELILRFTGGSAARCVASLGPRPEEQVVVTVGTRRLTITADSDRVGPALGPARAALDAAGTLRRRLFGGGTSLRRSYERQLRAFLECVQAGRGALAVSPGTADGIAAMLALQAARDSLAAHGAEVAVPALPVS